MANLKTDSFSSSVMDKQIIRCKGTPTEVEIILIDRRSV